MKESGIKVAKEMVWCGSRPTGSSWWARRRTPPRLGVWATAGPGAARFVTAMTPPAATAAAPSLRRSRRVGAAESRRMSMEASSLVRAVQQDLVGVIAGVHRAVHPRGELLTPQGRRRSSCGTLLHSMPEVLRARRLGTWESGLRFADTLGWGHVNVKGMRIRVVRGPGPQAAAPETAV